MPAQVSIELDLVLKCMHDVIHNMQEQPLVKVDIVYYMQIELADRV